MSLNFEVKQISEREYWVGENKLILTDQNIVHVITIGEQTTEMAVVIKDINLKLFSLVEGQTNFLIDLNKSGKNSTGARSIWNELSAHEKIKKAAVFGLNPVSRVIASFVIGFSVKKNQQFFKTEEEALSWLLED